MDTSITNIQEFYAVWEENATKTESQNWLPADSFTENNKLHLFTSNNNHQILTLPAFCTYLPDGTTHLSCLFGFPRIQLFHIVSSVRLSLL